MDTITMLAFIAVLILIAARLHFHHWSKWEAFEESGTATFKWGKMAGKQAPYTKKKQKRFCKTCGKTEEEQIY